VRKYKLKEIFGIAKTKQYISNNIDYPDYYNFVRLFNRKISKEIIGKNYKFSTGFGVIGVKKQKRTKPPIDWGSSNKLKQQIIDEGGTPFNKITNPQGTNWFIYFESSIRYKWDWFKDGSTKFIKDVAYWRFVPMSDNRKNLGKTVSKNPFAEIDYELH
jgi:hypothetical protein